MSSSLPPNAHISNHPCLRAKLSQLRSHTTNARETKALIHEIALIVGCEALAHGLETRTSGTNTTPLGYSYTTETIAPQHIALIPILRSGLGMLDALSSLLPHPVSVHHLGLYREKSTLQPVEYYNNLPYHRASTTSTSAPVVDPSAASSSPSTSPSTPSDLAILIDPIIATGATACAAIETLRDWGAKRIIMISVLASAEGLRRAASEWENVEVWVGGCDESVDGSGMIRPGLGDVGDRLFLSGGK